MALDPNIILGIQPAQLANPLDMQAKALTMSNMANQNKIQTQQMADDQAVRSAFQNNMKPGADGSPQVDRAGVLSDLARTSPLKAMEQQRTFTQQDAAMQDQKMKNMSDQLQMRKQLFNQIPTDPSIAPEQKQAEWSKMKALTAQNGLSVDMIPDQYPGDNHVKMMQGQLLSAEEKIAQHNKDREFDQKKEELGYKHEQNQIMRAQLNSDKDTKAAQDLDKHLALGWTARSGQAGVVQGKIVSAEAAQQLFEQGKTQPGGLDSRQIEEAAQSVGKLLGGGATASARIDALVPKTLMGKAQSFKEWITNNPTGANAQAFVQRLEDTVTREKALAENQKTQFQIEGLPAYARLKSRNPEVYNSILRAKGIDPSMIDKNGRYKAPDASPFHSMDDAELDKAYKAAGGK